MSSPSRKVIFGILLLLGAGTAIGWFYGQPIPGLAIAAIAALFWQIRKLAAFDRALHTGDFDEFRYGEGFWQQVYARLNFEHERGGRYKQQYRRLLKEIRKSTNAMPDGAVILDEANEILACNRASKELAGLKRKKDRGQRIDNILRDPELTMLLAADDARRTVDIESPVKNGAWLNCRVVPYGVEQKMLLLREVTERKALDRMRRDFVANASHELRSPLTVISGYLESLAEDQSIPPDLSGPLEKMRSQTQRMTTIIDELLELSRLEGSGQAGKENVVDISALLHSARKAYEGHTDVPTIEIEAEATTQLYGSPSEIESVIANLVSNAVRHTDAAGTVSLAWRSGPSGADLVVTDTGEGIAEEHIPRLTERFFRVDRGRAREEGGFGLGLAIVKHVLSRYDAELFVRSAPGEGSTFCCHFPPARLVVDPPIPIVGTVQGL